jgi:hypothetical protein
MYILAEPRAHPTTPLTPAHKKGLSINLPIAAAPLGGSAICAHYSAGEYEANKPNEFYRYNMPMRPFQPMALGKKTAPILR